MSNLLPKQSILVVDDIPDNIDLLTEVLAADYHIRVATSGEKALKIVYSDNPYWESRWLNCLGEFGCEVRDIRELLATSEHANFSACLKHQFLVHRLTRHRADHDAYAMYMAVSKLRGSSK